MLGKEKLQFYNLKIKSNTIFCVGNTSKHLTNVDQGYLLEKLKILFPGERII